jgi:hypothetical protein
MLVMSTLGRVVRRASCVEGLREAIVMTYMLLIVEPVGQRGSRSEADGRELNDSMIRFSAELTTRGLLTMSRSLRTDTKSARVQVWGQKPIVMDGPFAETKETIGGFFLLNCETREQAIAIAAECPAAKWATVEVRELGPCFE